jgi:GH25 family lysozyme M1 (1,4-beta-N-acetylmuramidase)
MTPTLGIDLYDHNPEPDWDALWALGCRLVYLKASEGGDRQRLFAPRAQRARERGWLVGGYSYHYAPRVNQAEAADLFASMVFEAGATDLRPAVDCESLCNASGTVCETPATTLARIESFVIALEACVGTECVIYTGPGFWASFGEAGRMSWLCRRALWCADYRPKQRDPWAPTGAPGFPLGWLPNRLALWQYDGTGIDKNLVIGNGLELLRWPTRELPSRPVVPDMWRSSRDAVESAEKSRKIGD